MLLTIFVKQIRNGTTNGSANGTPVKIENSKENHRGSHQALERTRSASDGDQHRPAKRSASDGDQRICTNGQPAEQPAQPVEKTDMKDDDAETLANIQEDVKTRLVTFQISMSSVMLFSVGSKQLLLEKKITEISYCTQVCDDQDLYIIRYLLLKYRLIFLWVLKVFDEPSGESNTERRAKISACISKEGTW